MSSGKSRHGALMFTVVISIDFKVSVVSCVFASVHMSFINEKMRSVGAFIPGSAPSTVLRQIQAVDS